MVCKIYVAATAEDIASASAAGFKTAQMIYKSGLNGRLYRAENAPDICGGVAVVDCTEGVMHAERLAGEIAEECAQRGYDSVVLEAGTAELARRLMQRGIKVFMDENCCAPGAIALIRTAMSGGSLAVRLNEAKRRHGRIAAEAELTRMDFHIPERSGAGRELSIRELDSMMQRLKRPVFYSDDLQVWYFTYRAEDGMHMVLYDNSRSLCRKMHVIREYGAECAFLSWEQIRHIKDEILHEMALW